MKSITIKDSSGKVLIKLIHRKNGNIELLLAGGIQYQVETGSLSIDVRDNSNHKMMFMEQK